MSDRRWAHQIMGYATVAGVEWVVITDGNEYRIYNALAHVPVEEKLFRAVQITDEAAPVAETLSLLSKDALNGNDLEHLWEAHFVDRQMKAALDELFSLDPSPSFVRLIKKRVKDLSTKDIKASLRRVQASFDSPVDPSTLFGTPVPSKPPRKRADKGLGETRKGKPDRAPTKGRAKGGFPATTRRFLDLGVKMRDVAAALIREGILTPPLELIGEYRGKTLKAQLVQGGSVVFAGKPYKSPSGAAAQAKATVAGRPMPTDGWQFWHYQSQNGEVVALDTARQEFLRRAAKSA